MTSESIVKSFTASDGYEFAWRHWPAENPAGCVVALHGIQSHSGWYGYSSARLAAAGFDVRFLDRRGSGLNDFDRGHADHVERLINDVVQFVQATRAEPGSIPLILLGVSWGGKLAAVVSTQRPELVDRLVLLYPGICARIRPRWYQRLLLRIATRLGRQRRARKIPLDDPALFTDEPHWQDFIESDSLALHKATLGLLSASVDLDSRLATCPQQIRPPTMMMLAGNDRIIDNATSRVWFAGIAADDKRLIEWPVAAHSLEFEPNRDEIFDELIAWLRG